jgi:hypothetical protein
MPAAGGHSPLLPKQWKYLLSQKDRSKETERLSAMNIRKTIMFLSGQTVIHIPPIT